MANGTDEKSLKASAREYKRLTLLSPKQERRALAENATEKMGTAGGPVEVDEAFIGGTPKFMIEVEIRKIW